MAQASPIPPVLLVGCGRMGSSLLHGWQECGLAPSAVVDPTMVEIDAPHRHFSDLDDLPADFQPAVVILAIKPQMADAALPRIAARAARAADAPVLSIMAGRTLASLSACFTPETAIVRAMPNLPASIGQGVTVACAGAHVSPAGRELCGRLLDAVGETAWVDDEAMLDPVTAISGGGPAYVFLLAELLEAAGRAHGLPDALARRLARRTISGAGILLEASPDEESAALRRAVTSPGGTTEQALAVLMGEDAWPRSVRAAIDAATQRSRRLAR